MTRVPDRLLDDGRGLPVADVIGRTVSLRRSGSALVGPCASTATSPSARHFSVRGHGWRCFSCGATGDLFSWLQWRDASDFPDCRPHAAAGLAGMDLPGQAAARDPAAASPPARGRRGPHRRMARARSRQGAGSTRPRATATIRIWNAASRFDEHLGKTLALTGGRARACAADDNLAPDRLRSTRQRRAHRRNDRPAQARAGGARRTYLTAAADNARDADGNKRKRGRPRDNA